MPMLPILISVAAIVIFALIIAAFTRFKTCPPDKIMVVYGTTGGNKGDTKKISKCIHGGATFVWPVFQGYGFLDLSPIQIDIPLQGALSLQNIRVNVPSTYTIRISEEEGIMQNAAINFFGQDHKIIKQNAEEIIYGQLRGVIAQLTIEEINKDRQKFQGAVSENIETELEKIGLRLINVNIKDITDESGYIEALGKEAAAGAVNEARVQVAKKERDGAIGTAEAQKEQRIQVSDANATAVAGEKDAERNQRVRVASAEADAVAGEKEAEKNRRVAIADRDAEAVEGENLAEVKKAQSESSRRQREAEAERLAVATEKVQAAEAEKEGYAAQKEAELVRAQKEEATQKANVIVPAEIAKEKLVIEAEAQAEKTRREQQGIADGEYARLEADGKGRRAVLEGIAEGLKAIVASADGDPEAAGKLMIVDKITELTRIQVEALKNIKIDKFTVWEGGGKSENGQQSISAAVQDLLKSAPGLADIMENVGFELPSFMGQALPEVADASEDLETAEDIDDNPNDPDIAGLAGKDGDRSSL